MASAAFDQKNNVETILSLTTAFNQGRAGCLIRIMLVQRQSDQRVGKQNTQLDEPH
jgi:hypothetical protein